MVVPAHRLWMNGLWSDHHESVAAGGSFSKDRLGILLRQCTTLEASTLCAGSGVMLQEIPDDIS
jgi:hypothetical protein